ncbi:ATP-dependent helicase HrpB [Gilvimarinus sp. 2_MG-2023]|uniref:ATP-dependent helicase HrpB n=1 Tax=Gilvimarinus sp. 2_MG-2023 TaxID=3062666 RepID=UPI0026E3B5E5|nr:ATP-dependent helicase HrpB [Gilvimarinus sp. 2_MG-2023]MDO6569906.1 ATP-dependent helicase HrpB [Gilvimarinus sp. 2_MG-2023]
MDSVIDLPLASLRDEFVRALGQGSLLLEAEPGAGKSTLAPLWVLEALGSRGQIWLIQPRILAARALANRLAAILKVELGTRVGYQVPFESRFNQDTQLLVMTPGVLLQRLLADPELTAVAAVMLDEIHERSVQQDTAWAFLQETEILRDDLQLVLMSATPDQLLRDQVAQSLYSPGRCFPVALEYCPAKTQTKFPERLEEHLLRTLKASAGWQQETLLVFLPGWRDIERCQQTLKTNYPTQSVFTLHSRVSSAEQMAALDPASGPRIILATNIAETSLTIADVTLVIDSGLVREPDYQQRTGVSRLHTRRISQASAEQRSGRAGRVQAGHCIRLWPESEPLAPQTLPEIRRCDYLPLALQLAHWGTPARELPWLEPPGAMALQQSLQTLQQWQLIDSAGAITGLGSQVSALGTHPRIAALLLHASPYLPSFSWLMLLALAMHFDLSGEGSVQEWLAQADHEFGRDRRWQTLARRWCRVLSITVKPSAEWSMLSPEASQCVAGVLAERIGHSDGDGRYRLNSGVTVALRSTAEWALLLQISARGRALTGVAVDLSLEREQIRHLAQARVTLEQQGTGAKKRWFRVCRYYLGGKEIDSQRQPLSADDIPDAIIKSVKDRGLSNLPWAQGALTLLLRARLAERYQLLALPPLDAECLQASLHDWLSGFLNSQSDIAHLPLEQGLAFYLGFETVQALDKALPLRLSLPSGRKVEVNYWGGGDCEAQVRDGPLGEPSIAAKLQEFFGAKQCSLPASQVPLAIELLSPAGRPLAITRDLAFFWREVYPEVRREVRGRYAKHPWPEDPLNHSATHLTKRRLES